MNIEISKLDFGRIDSRNEIDSSKIETVEFFHNSFLIPPNVKTADFFSGRSSFIIGLKGTGKTALLQYLKIEAENKRYDTRLILFKREFTEEDRQNFSRAAGYSLVAEQLKQASSEIVQDFEDSWFWFFHRYLYSWLIEKHGVDIVQNPALKRYLGLIAAVEARNEPVTGWTKWLPSMKNGKIKLGGDAKFLKGEFSADLDFSDVGEMRASLSQVVKICNKEIKAIKSIANKSIVLIDEIEISLTTADQFSRDCRIIRDLVVVISRINDIFRGNRIPINIVTGIRSEVLNSVNVLGKEVNKIAADFGITINWHGRDDGLNHPLFEVFRKKIEESERLHESRSKTEDSVWVRYFPERIQGSELWEYIIRKTWYRPRDMVRLFNLAKDESIRKGSVDRFTDQDLQRIAKPYASESWKEITEELHTIYTQDHIRGIKQLFTGFKTHFSFNELLERQKTLSSESPSVRSLNSIDFPYLIESLYRISIIGNEYTDRDRSAKSRPKQRWAYRGDDEPVTSKDFALHRGLRAMFSV